MWNARSMRCGRCPKRPSRDQGRTARGWRASRKICPMQLNYIANANVPSASGRTLPVIDPSDGQVFDHIQRSNAADIDSAVRAARDCFDGVWHKVSAADRGRLLYRLSQKIAEHVDELA